MPTAQQGRDALSRIRESQIALERENALLKRVIRAHGRELLNHQHRIDGSWIRRLLARWLGHDATFGRVGVELRRVCGL